MKKRFLSILMVLSMCVSMLPVPALAAEDTGLCDHHTAHTAECHYAEAVAGTPCGHEHTAECYTAGVLPDGDSFDVYATGEDTNVLNCQHQHDDTCGYVAAVEAHDCYFECAECAALVCDCGTDDAAIHATTCAVYVAPENPVCYCAEKCTEVNEWCDVCGFDISKCTGTDTAVGYAEGDVASVTVGDTTTNYTSLDDALIAAQNNPGSTLTLLQNIDRGSEELMIRSVPDSTFTIDLNGCTLTSTTATGTVFIQTSVNLTVVDSKGTGGIISNNNAFYIDWNNTTVNIKGVTITVTSTLDYDACVFINNSSATVNIIDSTILSERVGVYGGGTLNISGDTRITATSSNMAAIHRTGGALTITGGSITGGVYVAGGTADIIGGTITEPRDYYNAVDVVNNAQVTISGGSISGVNADLCNDSYNPGVINLTLSEGKTVGATFPSGITVEGNTLAELLSTDTATYWGVVDGKDTMLTVADDAATGITDKGDITIRAICDHKDVKLDYITTETTHTPVCSVCNWTGEATEHTGGTATCQNPAVCEACGVSYGDKDANIHTPTEGTIFTDNGDGTHSYTCACGAAVAEVPHTLDVTTGKCGACGADMTAIATVTDGTNTYYAADAATLNQAVTAILETGSRTFTVELPADAEAEMITAIRRAICDTEGVADGSIHLTLKGVTSIPGTTSWDAVAFGPRNAQWDENNVEIVSHEEVTQLASVNLPDVTEIGAQAFLDCSNLASITAPKVQSIGDWGLQGTAITSIDMPLLKEARYSAFCRTALTEVSLPSLETAGVIVFGHCEQLRIVDLPKLQNLSQQLFTRCTSLVSVSAPAATSMGNNVFKGCSELVSITLPGVTELTYEAFAECTKLENITLGSVITKVNVKLFAGEALSSGITLTLNCGQEKAETLPAAVGTNVAWAGFTWKEVKFAHSYVNSKCTACGEDCAHTGGTATCTTPAVCEACGASYGEVDKTKHDSSVECENGFCPNGCYEPATLNAEGYYEIDNAGKLFWFAQQVNVKGNREIKGVLTADIDLENKPWTPIGVTGENNNNFRGVFDGQNYTIRGLNVEGSENGVGFFGEVRTGTVKNFTIFGNVVVNTEVDYVGGVIGSICGVNGETSIEERNGAIIQNITSFVNVTAKAHGIGMIGGFVGYANHQSLIEKCAWYGTFDAGEYRVDSGAGGFIGKIQENTSEVTIRNCGAYGTIKTGYAGDISIGGFLGLSDTGAKTTIENSLFAGRFERGANLTDEARLGAFGTLRSVNAIKNCYYLGDDGLAAVHSDSNLKPGSGNVEITSVTGEDLRAEMLAVWARLGEYWTQGIHYPILKEGQAWHSDSATYTYTDNGDGTHKKTCNECGYVEEVKEEHYVDPTTTYTDNGNGTHSFKCAKCDAVMDSEPHTIENHVCTACGAMEIVVSFDAGDYEWKTGDTLYFCRVSGDNEWEEYAFTATVAGDGTVTWTPDRTLYWDGTGEHKLVVIYPDTGYVWDTWYIDEDQSTLENLRKNDHLNSIWSGNPTTDPITFDLKHRLAKVTVNYEAAEGVTVSKAEVYTLTQYLLFDIHTLERKNVAWEEGHDLWINSYHNGNQFTAFVSPDAYAADGNFIKITLSDGSVREVKMNKAVTFEEGAEYTYKVVITADGAYLTCADECTFEYTDNEDGLTHSKVCTECGYVAASENHTLTYTTNGNTITESCSANCGHTGTATISATGKTYDGNAVEVVVSKTGSLENTDIPVTLTKDGEAFTGEPVNAGAYTASVTLGDKTVSVDFTIDKAAAGITFAPTPDTLTYIGEAQYLINPGEAVGGTMVYSLTENGEYTTSIPQGTNAGEYTVWYYVQGDANHKDSAKDSVSVSIAKAPLTVTADAKAKIYGDEDPTLTYTEEGLLGGDTLTSALSGALSREEGENVGSYAITLGTLSADNYTISFVEADLFIHAKEVTDPIVTLEQDSYAYDGTPKTPAIAELVADGERLTEGTDFTVAYKDNINAGTSIVTITFKSNYTGEVTKTFTISKALLTVTADSKTMITGQELPTFTYTITGFVHGETEDVLTTKPTVSCEANGQTAGTYDITVSGAAADNYEITHVNGALSVVDHQHAWTYTAKDDTITATCNAEGCPDAEQSITISAVGKTYDGTPVTATLTSSIDGVATPEITYSGNTNAGTYTASITINGKTASVEFTISKANQVAPNLSKTGETLKGQKNGTITGVTNKMEYTTTSGGSYTAITGTMLDNLAAGTYYVRLAADANHNASPDTAVTIAAGKAITVTYDQGTQAASGMPAQLTDLSYGTKLTKPADPVANNTDFAFVGWYEDAACTTAWDFATDTLTAENVTLYAKWKQVYFSVTAEIVDHENKPYPGTVEVDLMRGNNLIDSVTGTSGSFTFSKHVEAGMYNLVAFYTDDAGEHTKTELVTVDRDDSYTLQLPAPGVNSHLDVSSNAETPAVMVGGLDDEAASVKSEADQASGGETVKEVSVTMDVEGKKETQVNDDVVQKIEQAIAEDSGTGSEVSTVVEYLEIEVKKEVVTDSGKTTTPITETANVIEIVIPFNFSGRTDIKIIRHHGDAAEALVQNSTKGNGTFYLDIENGYIHIFTNLFSTYAVSYTTSYNVTFDMNGGDGSNSNASTNADGTVVLPSDPTRSGYTFKGWYTASSGGTKVTSDYVFSGDTTVYAQWAQNYTPPAGGGGTVTVSYTVTVEDSTNGTVRADRTRTSSGTTVTLTVTPDTGYTLETLTVMTNSGREIELTNKDNGKYTFKMPSSKVTVKATFMDDNTMLNFFVDVPADAYYYDAVLWAAKSGITSGTTATTFSPNNPCTRAQMATFLWRTAGSPEPVGKSNPFTDVRADAYYAKAVQWAYEQGITGGTSATTFSPDDTCTRGQMATFLWRNAGSKAPVNNANQFADVPAEKYYAVAVQWAYEQKITSGTSATTFSPDDPCTRAQMVTFLYRFFVK